MKDSNDRSVEALLAPWDGPCGGTPPFDQATPEAIRSAYEIAIARKSEEVRAIAANPDPDALIRRIGGKSEDRGSQCSP